MSRKNFKGLVGDILPEPVQGIDFAKRNDAIEQGYPDRSIEQSEFFRLDGRAYKMQGQKTYYYLIDWGTKIEKLSKPMYKLLFNYRYKY